MEQQTERGLLESRETGATAMRPHPCTFYPGSGNSLSGAYSGEGMAFMGKKQVLLISESREENPRNSQQRREEKEGFLNSICPLAPLRSSELLTHRTDPKQYHLNRDHGGYPRLELKSHQATSADGKEISPH